MLSCYTWERLTVVWSIIPLANGEPFLEGAYPYLKVALDWAQTLGLKVGLSSLSEIAR